MGLARAAELNSYPGPRHFLDAVREGRLQATSDQIKQTSDVFDRMQRDAKRVGGQILAEEVALEAAFQDQTITGADLRSRVARIAALQGELRTIHLGAHLVTRGLLTKDQVQEYDRLRGHSTPTPAHDTYQHGQ
jgi:hypothetical protein